MDEEFDTTDEGLTSRAPRQKDLAELEPGEIAKYTVIRVGDEICVDLMASVSGIGYEEASQDQIIRMVDVVPIPFASPPMLWPTTGYLTKVCVLLSE